MKKRQEKDYWNYDYIDLSVKTDSADEVVSSYNTFGWQETDRFADKQYKDVLHLSFKRERKITDKDRLQYLQVSYEMLLNKRNTREYKMHDKSSLVLTLLCVLIVGVLISGCLILSRFNSLISNVVSSALIIVGTVGGLLAIKLNRKMRKQEKAKYLNYARKINGQISDVLLKVRAIRGNKNEK